MCMGMGPLQQTGRAVYTHTLLCGHGRGGPSLPCDRGLSDPLSVHDAPFTCHFRGNQPFLWDPGSYLGFPSEDCIQLGPTTQCLTGQGITCSNSSSPIMY